MSYYVENKVIVRGRAPILEEFVRYLEHHFRKEELGYFSYFENSNCYVLEMQTNHCDIFNIFDCDSLHGQFPSLRFDYIIHGEDRAFLECYSVYYDGILQESKCGESGIFSSKFDELELRRNFIPSENLTIYPNIQIIPNLAYMQSDGDLLIKEKLFSEGIPHDINMINLRIIDENHETLAFFYMIGFILSDELFLKKSTEMPSYDLCDEETCCSLYDKDFKDDLFSSPERFCFIYDQILEDYLKWNNAGLTLKSESIEDQVRNYDKTILNLHWKTGTLMKIKAKNFPLKMMGLVRLAYPYHCQVEQVKKNLLQLESKVNSIDILRLNDVQVLRTAYDLDLIAFSDLLPCIIEKTWLDLHPEYWLSADTIEQAIEFAVDNQLTELTAFLLDYKNTHFNDSLELDLGNMRHSNIGLWRTIDNHDGSLTITEYNGNDEDVDIPAMIGDRKVSQIGCHQLRECIFHKLNVKSVKIKEGIEIIGPNAFNGCVSLEAIELPPGLRMILGGAFSNCENLRSIVIPEGVKEIGISAFGFCYNLMNIILPKSLLQINHCAFYGCENLTSLSIPSGVKWIEDHVFYCCVYLKYVLIPEEVEFVSNDAFEGCESLIILGKSQSYIHQYALEKQIPFFEKDLVFGSSPLGLIFIPESRARELADCFNALVTARTWGEFRGMVSRNIYEFYLPESVHYEGPVGASVEDLTPFYIPDETPFTPNDVLTFDHLPGHPEIEMTEWMPDEVQEKFGRRFKYTAMDMNVPGGEGLALDESKTDEIVETLESYGFQCRRDDALILAAMTSDYNTDEFDDLEV